jgi:hypothetical protein
MKFYIEIAGTFTRHVLSCEPCSFAELVDQACSSGLRVNESNHAFVQGQGLVHGLSDAAFRNLMRSDSVSSTNPLFFLSPNHGDNSPIMVNIVHGSHVASFVPRLSKDNANDDLRSQFHAAHIRAARKGLVFPTLPVDYHFVTDDLMENVVTQKQLTEVLQEASQSGAAALTLHVKSQSKGESPESQQSRHIVEQQIKDRESDNDALVTIIVIIVIGLAAFALYKVYKKKEEKNKENKKKSGDDDGGGERVEKEQDDASTGDNY